MPAIPALFALFEARFNLSYIETLSQGKKTKNHKVPFPHAVISTTQQQNTFFLARHGGFIPITPAAQETDQEDHGSRPVQAKIYGDPTSINKVSACGPS
jgi:hypothetical protein